MSLSRYLAPSMLAASLGLAALAAPAPAQAQSNDLVRVLVNVADVVMRGNTPYYRNGDYGNNDRLIAQRDRYGRVVYYRDVRDTQNRNGPPYGNAYGYYRNGPGASDRNVKCNKHGKCKSVSTYYDPRHDRDRRNSDRDDRHDDHHDNYSRDRRDYRDDHDD
ncbi:MAG: hypothetical protein M3Q51_00840 [Pseudomonadota bacterium]|nr:hypothetical protein [Pseudomonadota bacterium]MDQ3159550.1 hypothetical protein [Pseudomonadota bacterium]